MKLKTKSVAVILLLFLGPFLIQTALAQVEYEPGERQAEILFDMGFGGPWIESQHHPEQYLTGDDLKKYQQSWQRGPYWPYGLYLYPYAQTYSKTYPYDYSQTSCYLIVVKENTAREAWQATVQYTDLNGRHISESFGPYPLGDQRAIYVGSGSSFVGTIKPISTAFSTPIYVNAQKNSLYSTLHLAVYKTDCRGSGQSQLLIDRSNSFGTKIYAAVTGEKFV
jgi:hypothetical protein